MSSAASRGARSGSPTVVSEPWFSDLINTNCLIVSNISKFQIENQNFEADRRYHLGRAPAAHVAHLGRAPAAPVARLGRASGAKVARLGLAPAALVARLGRVMVVAALHVIGRRLAPLLPRLVKRWSHEEDDGGWLFAHGLRDVLAGRVIARMVAHDGRWLRALPPRVLWWRRRRRRPPLRRVSDDVVTASLISSRIWFGPVPGSP
ncbi:short-chain dehydrogenase reductase 2a-like [Dorcoceras hygrometricum]|uniref:Short-chain dehydrogenase reductase 2a-like n=1 Tax=Dorcoceras hygrometricum TaxID=472368 RepID=A0A2Z7CHG6_9LAMI|nr:short-chain dehydrogenase reductase 2a-like [Dorcoceras hygrometricum]